MNYPGANKPLTVENALQIINGLHSPYSDFPYNVKKRTLDGIAEIIKCSLWKNNRDEFYIVTLSMLQIIVGAIHTLLSGQNWTKNIDESNRAIKEALIQLSKSGKAQQISKNEWEERSLVDELFEELITGTPAKPAQQISEEKWRIPPLCQQILGEGEDWVYLYYFDKEKAKAQDQGKEVWPCNIGFTKRQPEKRIQEQMAEDSDIPIIALLLRTDKPKLLEKTIHGILKLRDSHLKQAQGNEWFLANPDEIVSIYRFITDSEYQITV